MFLSALVVFTLLGLFVGSFLNVCIDRLPKGQSIVFPSSRCAGCGHKLRIIDLVPVFSYLWLRGRCRYCGIPIPRRIPVVEAAAGVLFVLIYWKYGISIELLIVLIYASIFLLIFVVDLETMYVWSAVVYPSMALALAFSMLWPGIRVLDVPGGRLVGDIASSLAGGITGASLMALPYLISRLVYRREAMGKGDIQLGALAGLVTGFPFALEAILLAVVGGGLAAGVLLLFKVVKRTEPIPFGPFLVLGAMTTLLWGQTIYQWYAGWMHI